jgi:hypothetical protein
MHVIPDHLTGMLDVLVSVQNTAPPPSPEIHFLL